MVVVDNVRGRRLLSLLPRSEEELVKTLGFTCFTDRRELDSTGRLTAEVPSRKDLPEEPKREVDPRREDCPVGLEEDPRKEDCLDGLEEDPRREDCPVGDWEPERREEDPRRELLFGGAYFSRRGFLIGIT